MRMFNEMIRLPIMTVLVILLFYTLLNPAAGKRVDTVLSRLGQVGLNVVDFVPKGGCSYGGITKIKLPTREEYLGTAEEFILMAEEHNQDTVYRNRLPAPWGVTVFYVFDQDKAIAWKYVSK